MSDIDESAVYSDDDFEAASAVLPEEVTSSTILQKESKDRDLLAEVEAMASELDSEAGVKLPNITNSRSASRNSRRNSSQRSNRHPSDDVIQDLKQKNAKLQLRVQELSQRRDPKSASGGIVSKSQGATAPHVLEQENRILHSQLVRLRKETDMMQRQMRNSLNPAKISELSNQLSDHKRMVAQLQAENKTLKLLIRRQETEMLKHEEAKGDLPVMLNQFREENRRLQEKVKAMTVSRDTNDRVQRKQHEQIYNLKSKNAKLSQRIKSKNKPKSGQPASGDLERQTKALERSVAQARQQRDEDQKKWRKMLRSSQKAVEKLQEQFDAQSKELSKTQAKLASAQRENDTQKRLIKKQQTPSKARTESPTPTPKPKAQAKPLTPPEPQQTLSPEPEPEPESVQPESQPESEPMQPEPAVQKQPEPVSQDITVAPAATTEQADEESDDENYSDDNEDDDDDAAEDTYADESFAEESQAL